MQADWGEVVDGGEGLAREASLADKSTIICRTGQLMLASGTGAWRVRDSMNRVARVLGVTVHVDLSLLSIECTCIEGHETFSEVVSLPTQASTRTASGCWRTTSTRWSSAGAR